MATVTYQPSLGWGFICVSLWYLFIHSLIQKHCLEPTICMQGAESTVKTDVDIDPFGGPVWKKPNQQERSLDIFMTLPQHRLLKMFRSHSAYCLVKRSVQLATSNGIFSTWNEGGSERVGGGAGYLACPFSFSSSLPFLPARLSMNIYWAPTKWCVLRQLSRIDTLGLQPSGACKDVNNKNTYTDYG